MRGSPLLFLAAVLVLPALSGCVVIDGEARTEWAFTATQLGTAASAGRTGEGVTVAILDTGINIHHNALKHLLDGNTANGELVGFQDYVGGRSGVANAYDDEGHGSHVAGIIAAEGSSLSDKLSYGGIDLRGGAPHVRLLVAKVCGDPAQGCLLDAIPTAIRWAVENRAQVISLSLGSDGAVPLLAMQSEQEKELTAAIDSAVAAGVVVVAAAGNAGPDDADVSTPADIPDVIAVGAIQQDGTVWLNSSRGDDAGHPCLPVPLPSPSGLPGPVRAVLPKLPSSRCDPDRKPELVAPGVDILSAWVGNGYVRARGTSQAAPFVTATVALLLEGHPALQTRDQVRAVKQALEATAMPVLHQHLPHDVAAGYGLVQAQAALDAYRP